MGHMIEAINSVISNASLLRAPAEQTSQSRALATNPDSVQVVPQAPYISPYIHLDPTYGKAVLALRDSDTGAFLTTIPSDARLQAQAQDLARQAHDIALSSQPRDTAPQQVAVASAAPQQLASAQPQISTASFGAFAKQVASLQTAITGGGTGSTVSLTA